MNNSTLRRSTEACAGLAIRRTPGVILLRAWACLSLVIALFAAGGLWAQAQRVVNLPRMELVAGLLIGRSSVWGLEDWAARQTIPAMSARRILSPTRHQSRLAPAAAVNPITRSNSGVGRNDIGNPRGQEFFSQLGDLSRPGGRRVEN